jgi:RimJ/RimL family protein N-acetyltransferase
MATGGTMTGWRQFPRCAHARNALALLLGYAASIGVTRLEAHVATDNHASRRVAESAGFTQAGTFTDDDGTEMIRYIREVPRPRGGRN